MYRYEMVTDNETGRTLPSPPLLGSSHFSGLYLNEDQDLLVPCWLISLYALSFV